MYRNSTILYNIIWVSYVYPGNSESRYRIWMTERTNSSPRQLIFEYLKEIEFYFFTSKYYSNAFYVLKLSERTYYIYIIYISIFEYLVKWIEFYFFSSKYYWNDFLYRNLAKKNTLYIICGRIQVSWTLFLPF